MNISAADILTVATYLWGGYSPSESFASMARRIVQDRPHDWQRVMREAEVLRGHATVHDYPAAAAALRNRLEN